MGLEMLPNELVVSLREQWPCRDAQIRQLTTLLSVSWFALDLHGILADIDQ
jgi:hypothetical protein